MFKNEWASQKDFVYYLLIPFTIIEIGVGLEGCGSASCSKTSPSLSVEGPTYHCSFEI